MGGPGDEADVGGILAGPVMVHGFARRKVDITARMDAALREAGLDLSCQTRFPHPFSGGERQPIGIAPALIVEPGLPVRDAPIAALHASIQAQIINLFREPVPAGA